jgi:hypothetical protein
MKKFYVLLLVTAGTILCAHAQPFEKGDKLLGGSVYFAHGDNANGPNQSSSNYNSFGVSPAFGIFTKKNQLTGIALSYQHTNSSDNSNPKQKSNGVSAGIYRQYWNSLSDKFYFIIQGQASVGYQNTSYTAIGFPGISSRIQKGYSAYFTVDPGFAYRVKAKLILDFYYSNFLRTGYSYAKEEVVNPGMAASTYKNSSIVLDAGLRNFSLDQFRFGFRYVL